MISSVILQTVPWC